MALVQYVESRAPTVPMSSQLIMYEPQPPRVTSNALVLHQPQASYLNPNNGALVLSQPSVSTGAVVPYTEQVVNPAFFKTNNGALVPLHHQKIISKASNEDSRGFVESPYSPPAVQAVGSRSAIYGRGTIPSQLLKETDLGDIVLVSEFSNTLRHARLALGPVLEAINTERNRHGLHPIGVRLHELKKRKQVIPLDRPHHLVIFCHPGTSIRHLNNKRDASDYKHHWAQVSSLAHDVAIFIIGPITSGQIDVARNFGIVPNPYHQELVDPAVAASGIFQGDLASTEKLKAGKVFSFVQQLNPVQIRRLADLVHKLSRKCKEVIPNTIGTA